MIRFASLALLALALTAGFAPAQVVILESRPSRVYYSAPRTVVYSSPVVTYSSAPLVTYSSPVVTYSSPIVTSSPLVSYSYYPAATTTVFSAPVVAVPGVVTTRSYVGYGIFRPRGVYHETYISPR